LDAIKNGKDKELVVLVDTDTSKENVMRAAASQGYRVEAVAPEADGYRLAIAKE
jgi:TusA-related sulfurtransferase